LAAAFFAASAVAQTNDGKAPASGGASTAERAPAAAQEPGSKLRFVRAGPAGAKARNLYDAQGVVVLDLPADTILAVHGERSGWLEIEAPGGFQVWVFGEFIQPASEAGVLQITANDVRMRPLPSSGPESLPLRQLLAQGDRVRLIARHSPEKSLAQDWVQIYSPPGAHAWVRAEETVPLAAGVDGASLWAQASLEAKQRPSIPVGSVGATPAGSTGSKGTSTASAPAAKPAGDGATSELLQKAESLLARERAKEQQKGIPSYAGVRAAYEEVLAAGPTPQEAELAQSRIAEVDAYSEAYKLRADLELERARREAALREREEKMKAAADRDVFEGRFDCRGWLERRQISGEEEPSYLLRWAGDQVAEVVCFSGRYDLSVFAGCELGVNGREVRGPLGGAIGVASRPRQIDVARLEVLAGSQIRR